MKNLEVKKDELIYFIEPFKNICDLRDQLQRTKLNVKITFISLTECLGDK